MLNVGIFIAELFLLFLLSRKVHIDVSRLVFSLTRNKNATVHVIAFIFWPGTFLHELAHYLMAIFLFVPAGQISLKLKLTQNSLRLGSVPIGKTDPGRRMLIGTAPVIVGLSIIFASLFYVSSKGLFENPWIILALCYIVFEVGNTMFSSKRDMEGAVELISLVMLLAIIGYILGLRISLSTIEAFLSQPSVAAVFRQGVIYLLLPIVVDIVFLLLLKIFHR